MKGLLFDKDGTLFDFDQTWGNWAKGAIDHLSMGEVEAKRRLSDAFDFDYAATKFRPSSPIIAGTGHLILSAILKVRDDLTEEDVMAYVSQSSRETPLAEVCDLRMLFKDLKTQHKIGLATNDSEASAIGHLRRANILQDFDYVAGSDSGFGSKPNCGMCEAFLQKFSIEAKDAVMIGDSPYDLIAGKGAGMVALGVLTGPASRDELMEYADDVIPSIAQLPKWLAKRAGDFR